MVVNGNNNTKCTVPSIDVFDSVLVERLVVVVVAIVTVLLFISLMVINVTGNNNVVVAVVVSCAKVSVVREEDGYSQYRPIPLNNNNNNNNNSFTLFSFV
jgi:H+/Cl- antiporter ClcA